MNLERPTFKDILEARNTICRYLPQTPLYTYPQLDQLLDAKVYVKHENHMPTGAFKVRGGINLISHLTLEEKKKGVVTASTGTTPSPSPTLVLFMACRRRSSCRREQIPLKSKL